jgi:hypothetical protein
MLARTTKDEGCFPDSPHCPLNERQGCGECPFHYKNKHLLENQLKLLDILEVTDGSIPETVETPKDG